MRRRLALLAVAAALVAAGLALRLPRWPVGPGHLPLAVHHHGGGLLWGGLVYALVAAARPRRWGLGASLAAGLAVIAAVEGSRLVHAPALDAFRRTLAGQLLLGRMFSGWNIAVDFAGAALVAAATLRLVRSAGARPRRPPRSSRAPARSSRRSR